MFSGIKGKKILITGSSSGIGACTAELFASYGADVGIHYGQNIDKAKIALENVKKYGVQGKLFQADFLTDNADNIIDEFLDCFGRIDVLVNNAGAVYGNMDFLEMDEESWNKTLTASLKTPFFISKKAFISMKKIGGGKIINISSIASKYGGSAKTLHYGVAKSGLDAITKTMAREGAEYNILVNSIQPGVIDTEFHKKIGRNSLIERAQKIPLKRAGKPEDVAGMCLFLASNYGNYITGQIFGVTGGD
ncbi:MAG: SDR family NAD(P)-dependent oxidoreductase [Methanomicrobium sp.]|nr:SDR family NAD(P)-dependent oxidoreductase [Methanomicrobium sp.]